jgi:hypothetical protein
VRPDRLHFDAALYGQAKQRVDAQHVVIENGQVQLFPVSIRFAFPPELDLMARLAGLRLRERWGGWCRRPFDSSSQQHISVWERSS